MLLEMLGGIPQTKQRLVSKARGKEPYFPPSISASDKTGHNNPGLFCVWQGCLHRFFFPSQHSSLWINSVWNLFGLILQTRHLTSQHTLSEKTWANQGEVKYSGHSTDISPSKLGEKQRGLTLSIRETAGKTLRKGAEDIKTCPARFRHLASYGREFLKKGNCR